MNRQQKIQMAPLDAMWRVMETHETPMHVGVLAQFKIPPRAAEGYMEELAEYLRSFNRPVYPWNQRWSAGPDFVARFEKIRDFDIEEHFRHHALPKPGGERQLGRLVSRLHSIALGPNSALWEIHLIEGLEAHRFAVYLKVHRALARGITAVPLLMSFLGDNPRKRKIKPFWTIAHTPDQASGEEEYVSWHSQGANDLLRSTTRIGRDLFRSVQNPREAASFLLPGKTPRSTLNRKINHQRRIATQQFGIQRLTRLAEAADSCIEDILMYLCGTALRRFFMEYNALPTESLIAGVPVELHDEGELGPSNAIAGLRLSLNTHLGDAQERLEAIKGSMRSLREEVESLPHHAVAPYTFTRSLPIYGSQLPVVGSLVPPLFNLSISGIVAGPKHPVFLRGARLEALYSLNVLMQHSALSIDVIRYGDTLNVALTGARDTLPRLQRIAVYMGRALDDLEKLYTLVDGGLREEH